jgi:hypothetical protein
MPRRKESRSMVCATSVNIVGLVTLTQQLE